MNGKKTHTHTHTLLHSSLLYYIILYYTLPGITLYYTLILLYYTLLHSGRPGSSEVPRNPLTRWDVSSTPANGIFLTKKQKNKNKNAQRVEND